jgi:hypothetical protein
MRGLFIGVSLLALMSTAQASLMVTATDNGAPLVFTPSTNTAGALIGTFADSNFSEIAISIAGVPNVPSPDLGTTDLSVSSAITGTHDLVVTAAQTGLSQPAGFNGTNSMTTNDQIGSGGPVTETFDVNGVQQDTATFPVTMGIQARDFTDTNLPTITSDSEIFSATFTAPQQDIEMTQEFLAAGATAVQEPGTMALFGMGLLSLVWFKRKKSS